MATSGPNTVGTVNTSQYLYGLGWGGGTLASDWTNPQNSKTEDAAFASVDGANTTAGGKGTWAFLFTGFGFSIPAGATIDDVKFEAKLKASHNNVVDESNFWCVADAYAWLLYNGDKIGTGAVPRGATDPDKRWQTTVRWDDTSGQTPAHPALWGATLTPEIINDSTFGVGFAGVVYSSDATTVTAYVDSVRVTITYTTEDGYQHTVCGVLPANIASIMGVPIANIAKFNGV